VDSDDNMEYTVRGCYWQYDTTKNVYRYICS
jgi:hypothetical protein